MAFTLSDYTALEQAIKTGVSLVQYADRQVRYRDLNEMIQLRKMMARELGLDKEVNARKVAEFSKGLKT